METLVFMDAKLKTYIFVKDSMVQFLFSSFLGNQTSCKHRDQRGIFTCIWAWASPPINPRLTHFFLLGMHFSLGGTGCWPPNIENLYRIIKRSVLVPILWKSTFWFGAVCPFRHHLFSVYGRALHIRDVKFCKTPLATINNVISN